MVTTEQSEKGGVVDAEDRTLPLSKERPEKQFKPSDGSLPSTLPCPDHDTGNPVGGSHTSDP